MTLILMFPCNATAIRAEMKPRKLPVVCQALTLIDWVDSRLPLERVDVDAEDHIGRVHDQLGAQIIPFQKSYVCFISDMNSQNGKDGNQGATMSEYVNGARC